MEETTIQSYEYFDPIAFIADDVDRFKRFEANGYPVIAFVSTKANDMMNNGEQITVPLLHSYYTQIEITGGLFGGFRLGFNPGELIDFTLGWFGIDIFKDDLEAKKHTTKSNKSSEVMLKPGAPQFLSHHLPPPVRTPMVLTATVSTGRMVG